jgi:hypothetical protein
MTSTPTISAPDVLAAVQRELARHPYRTVGIAVGIGYLLGTRIGKPLLSLVSGRLGIALASALVPPLVTRAVAPDADPGVSTRTR